MAPTTPSFHTVVFPMPGSPERRSAAGPAGIESRNCHRATSSDSRPMMISAKALSQDDGRRDSAFAPLGLSGRNLPCCRLRGVNSSQVAESWRTPRRSLHPPRATRGNMYFHASHRTSALIAYIRGARGDPRRVGELLSHAQGPEAVFNLAALGSRPLHGDTGQHLEPQKNLLVAFPVGGL